GPSLVPPRGVIARLAGSANVRISLIDLEGRLIVDSRMDDAALNAAENHLGRTEVQDALDRGQGLSRHFSRSLSSSMLYAALPYSRPEGSGVVRVAMSLEQVEGAIGKLRWMLAAAGLVGLAAAFLVSGLASYFASRALRQLVAHAQRIARGDESPGRSPGPAGSFSKATDDLERVVLTLGHERDQFAAILESMSEGVIAVDSEERITLINGAAIALLGTSAQPLGRSLLETVDNTALSALVRHAVGGEAARNEFNVGERRVLARATPLSVSAGSVVVMHDITDLRHLETVRRDFVANVSHELRTPVSVIQANAETLLDGALEDPQAARGFVEALLRNAERLGRIIADLL
ncbi:MAG TPA: histidine kinase dimerization/phospho-acceptor domain-containing protein, partial [Myxococcota bacterium]|nr:histidine kinase dimerization/phospho-acceptor domain-containing protein [Myxococcota bacterium]